MFRKLLRNKAQTTLEYAILIGVIVAGLIAMQVYVRRGLQGKLKENADSMGTQFSPGSTTIHYGTANVSKSHEESSGGATTTTITEQSTDRTGNETVQSFDDEYWPGEEETPIEKPAG